MSEEMSEETITRAIMLTLSLSDEAEDFDLKLSQIRRIVNLTVRAICVDNEELLRNSIFKWNSIIRDEESK